MSDNIIVRWESEEGWREGVRCCVISSTGFAWCGSVAMRDSLCRGEFGKQVTHHVKQDGLPTRILLMTGYDDVEQAIHAALAGAAGYCSKDVESDKLPAIVRQIAAGKLMFGQQAFSRRELELWVDEQIDGARRSYSEPGSPFHPLSAREMEVLQCVVHGMSNKDIAGCLGISHQTVKNHMTSILRKLDVEDRTQAAIYAIRHGWVRLHDIQPSSSRDSDRSSS